MANHPYETQLGKSIKYAQIVSEMWNNFKCLFMCSCSPWRKKSEGRYKKLEETIAPNPQIDENYKLINQRSSKTVMWETWRQLCNSCEMLKTSDKEKTLKAAQENTTHYAQREKGKKYSRFPWETMHVRR